MTLLWLGRLNAAHAQAPDEPAVSTDEAAHSVTESEAPSVPTAEQLARRQIGHGQRHHAPRLVWQEGWRRTNALDYSIMGVALVGTVTAEVIGPLRTDNPLRGSTALDRAVRSRIASENDAQRGRMRDASDLLLSLAVSYPLLFDGLATALWYHGSVDVGRELALISLEVQFITSTLQSFTKIISSRERPYADRCDSGDLPAEDGDCNGSTRYRSFFSGHTSQAFAGAATSCVFHSRLPLYGGGAPDVLACVGALGVATTTALLRITADMHHTTDVITGALVGTAFGIMVPMLRMRRGRGLPVAILPSGMGGRGLGLTVMGGLQ